MVRAARAAAVSDGRDASVLDGDVGDVPRIARAVQQPPAGKDEVELPGPVTSARRPETRRRKSRPRDMFCLHRSGMVLSEWPTERNARLVCSRARRSRSSAASTAPSAPSPRSAAVRSSSGARPERYIEDVDGKRYVDYVMSWGPLIHGHAPRGLRRALASAAAARHELRRAARARDRAGRAGRRAHAVDRAHPFRELGHRSRR